MSDAVPQEQTSNADRPQPVVFGADGQRLNLPADSDCAPYDFRNPAILSQAALRRLDVLHERFAQHLSAKLATLLRLECVFKVAKFETTNFARFCEELAPQTQLTLFQISSLRGVGILDLSLPLAAAMADRLLGGRGRLDAAPRTLSEIELALLEDVTALVLHEWTSLWSEENGTLEPQTIGHETSGRFLQTAAPDETFMLLAGSVTIGEGNAPLQIALPFSMIEPLLKQSQQTIRTGGGERREKQMTWRAPFSEITVPLEAEWRVSDLTLGNILELKVGEVIELPKETIDRTHIRLSETEEFIGTVGVQNGFVAVQLGQRALTS